MQENHRDRSLNNACRNGKLNERFIREWGRCVMEKVCLRVSCRGYCIFESLAIMMQLLPLCLENLKFQSDTLWEVCLKTCGWLILLSCYFKKIDTLWTLVYHWKDFCDMVFFPCHCRCVIMFYAFSLWTYVK